MLVPMATVDLVMTMLAIMALMPSYVIVGFMRYSNVSRPRANAIRAAAWRQQTQHAVQGSSNDR
jgi:hypothetical protein